MGNQKTKYGIQEIFNYAVDDTVKPPLITMGMMAWNGSAWIPFNPSNSFIRLDGTNDHLITAEINFPVGLSVSVTNSLLTITGDGASTSTITADGILEINVFGNLHINGENSTGRGPNLYLGDGSYGWSLHYSGAATLATDPSRLVGQEGSGVSGGDIYILGGNSDVTGGSLYINAGTGSPDGNVNIGGNSIILTGLETTISLSGTFSLTAATANHNVANSYFGNINALSNNTYAIGTSSVRFTSGWFAGRVSAGQLTADSNSTTTLLVEQNGVNYNVLLVDTTNARVAINTTSIGYAFEVVNTEAQQRAVDVRAAWTTRPGSFAIAMGASLVMSFTGSGLSGGGIAGFFSISDTHVVNTLSNDIVTGYDFTASRASPHSSIGLSNTFRLMRLSQSDVGTYIRTAGNTTQTTPNMTLVNTSTFTYDITQGTPAAASRTMTHTNGAFDSTITFRPTIVGVSGTITATLNTDNFFARVAFSNTGGNPTLDANSLLNISYGGMKITGTYLNTSTSGTVSSISYALFSSATGADKDFFGYNGTISDTYVGLDGAKLLFGTGTSTAIGATLTYNAGDVFITHTASSQWDFDTVTDTTVIRFNPSAFDVDQDFYGNTDILLHLDANGDPSYLEQQVANSTTFFQFRQLDGTVFATVDSSTPAILMATTAPIQFRASTQSIYSSAASTLDLNANTTMILRIATATEITLTANTLTFENGAIDTSIGWGTSNQLDITAGATTFSGTVRLKNYTVATLPAGVQGDTAYVTDALAPAFLTAVVGGGAIVTPVFYDGTNWIAI